MLVYILIAVFFLSFLLFIYCLTKVASESGRQEDDRQQILFLENYQKEHAASKKP